MKRLQLKYILTGVILASSAFYACKKTFLDVPPVGTLNPSIVANLQGVQGLLIGAYATLDGYPGNGSGGWGGAISNWTFGSIAADDAYKGSTPDDQGPIIPLENWTVDAGNDYCGDKWQNSYYGVQRANDVLRILPLAKDISADEVKSITAEARFLRGFHHFELKKVFGNVPYVGEDVTGDTSLPTSVTNISGSGYVNIWPQIEADFMFGMQNLPVTQAEVGRVNKWAAQAFLAKVYMFEGKYTDAKPLLDELISSGTTSDGLKYGLTNYFSNFNPGQNHKGDSEAVFVVQMAVNEGSGNAQNNGDGVANGNYGDLLNFPYNAGPGACCGFFDPSQSLANSYKTDANGLPYLDESYNSGNNVNTSAGPYTGTLDPRVDMAIGRKGIPYLDWGPHPGDAWIRDPANNGHFNPKKNVYALSQKGTLSSTESYWASTELTANNVNVIRFADVLLWAAEADLKTGDPATALKLVNRVRARAADRTGWVYAGGAAYDATKGTYSPQTTPAANYKIGLYATGAFGDPAYAMKAIMFERRLELSMEGQRFFDLVRWGVADVVLNAYAAHEKTIVPVYVGAKFTKGKNEIFPIPQSQIDALAGSGTPYLKQNPMY
ncbi:MAG: RagB/SusD family nutrient uptake outer membrane protein [Ferruginibacter sp.]